MSLTPPPPHNPLVASARKWAMEALDAWVAGDSAKITTVAPIAVEHLGKALLWSQNPVLLTPLSENHAGSLVILSTTADLANPKLRTIGLRETLSRASDLATETFPLSEPRRKRLIDCRGGAIHAGQFDDETAQNVLADALAVLEWLRAEMGLNERQLYAQHVNNMQSIVDERRNDVQKSVDRQIARARSRYTSLIKSIGDQKLIADTIAQKEALIGDTIPKIIDKPTVTVAHKCPVCSRKGALLGDARPEWESSSASASDAEPRDDEDDIRYIHFPDSFYCHVCGFLVGNKEALAAAGLPNAPYEVPDDEITPELVRYMKDPAAWMDDES